MKTFFTALGVALTLLMGAPATAQTFPPVPASPPANLQGQALRDWLRTNWYDGKRTVLSYSAARAKMYNYADNYNNSVTCVYSGYNTPVPLSFTSSNTSSAAGINCEHTIPQSWFTQAARMVSDMHHLYPTYVQWNSNRGNDPFADIPDATTTIWMRNTTSQATIPTTLIDEWSEDTNTRFEPREDHKGNVARTAFYFYTMHDTQPELIATGHQLITSLADLATLYRWHLADPVDAHEIERNRRVAASQGNYNPYILNPGLVAQAYNLAPTGPAISFSTATGSQAEGNNGVANYTVTLTASPAPTAPLTVQVTLDAANSTATNGTDFTFASPQTVTFAAGQTSQTVTVAINGDVQPELDETVVLNLTNPGTGASVGSPGTHTLTITNDDGQPATVSFATATGSQPEGNSGTSTYTIAVNLANYTGPAFTVPVTVEASGTTATSPADYTLNTSTLTFGGVVPPGPVTLTIVGDLVPEPNETVRLRLGTPSNATVLLGTNPAHTLTILNDDALPAGLPCTKLYFSQYAESLTGNSKAVEIYNPTAAAVPLAGKRLELFANGRTAMPTTQALTGSIPAYGTYVVANTGATDASLAAVATGSTGATSSVAFFNGDDALALFDGTDTLDIIGVIGQQPTATGWTTAGGGSTLNNTLVRLPTANQGGRWNGPNGATTWTGNGVDVFAGFGSYTSTACGPLATRVAATFRNALALYPNPASAMLTVGLPGAAAQPATVALFDNLGRCVRTQPATLGAAATARLDLRGLPAGLYAVRVSTATADYTGRVVVE